MEKEIKWYKVIFEEDKSQKNYKSTSDDKQSKNVKKENSKKVKEEKPTQDFYEKKDIEDSKSCEYKQVLGKRDTGKASNRISVWDLPVWAKKLQVFESVRYLGRVKFIEIIREAYGKTRAEIEFEPESLNTEEIERTWCISFLGDYLVRITPGISNFEKLRIRSKYSRRLINLPENTNEVLLWRQIRRTRAKSLHIFKNTNRNNMRSATVYFLNEKDLLDSSRFTIYYYDDKLRWASLKDNNLKSKQNAEIQEEAQLSTQKRSEKSLGKMREVEQDPIEESSKHAQRRLWNKEEKSTVWKDFLVKETQENK